MRRGPAAGAALLACVLTGCGTPAAPAGGGSAAHPGDLTAFADCDKFAEHMKGLALARTVAGRQLAETIRRVESTTDAPGNAFGTGPAPEPEAPTAGPDLAATDGKLLVTVRLGRLHVLDVSGKTPRRLGHVDVAERFDTRSTLVLTGRRVLIVSPASNAHEPVAALGQPPWKPTTDLTLVSIDDPRRPRILGSMSVTARHLLTRRTGDVVRVVLVTDPEARPAAAATGTATAADWLPERQVRDRAGNPTTSGPLLDCTAVRRPAQDAGLDLVSVLTVDPTREDGLTAVPVTGVLASGDAVAASAERLFVVHTPHWGSDGIPAGRPDEPRPASAYVHSFDLTGDQAPEPVASGPLDRYVLAPGSLSARGSTLRVLGTDAPPWASLGPKGGPLDVRVSRYDQQGRDLVDAGGVHLVTARQRVKVVRWLDDLVAVAPRLSRNSPFDPNSDAERMRVALLPAEGAPERVPDLTLPQRTAALVPAGGGVLLAVGHRYGLAGNFGEDSLEVATLRLGRDRHARLDTVSYGPEANNPYVSYAWLPEARVLAIAGTLDRAADCPAGPRCLTGGLPGGGAEGIALDAGPDGRLSQTGTLERYEPWLLAVGGRLAAFGDSITLLDPRTLRPLGRTVALRAPEPPG